MREEEYLMLSGIQHFAFCRRQWALIHIEQQWAENVHTVEGQLMHHIAHDDSKAEKRKDVIILHGIRVVSQRLGITGVCDVVEFQASDQGIHMHGWDGSWRPYPVEYKKGRPKQINADELQLCAECICLEEMLCCEISEGSLYYGATHRRQKVQMTKELRKQTENMLHEMRGLYERGWTPGGKVSSKCKACSLREVCLPELVKTDKVETYLDKRLRE